MELNWFWEVKLEVWVLFKWSVACVCFGSFCLNSLYQSDLVGGRWDILFCFFFVNDELYFLGCLWI